MIKREIYRNFSMQDLAVATDDMQQLVEESEGAWQEYQEAKADYEACVALPWYRSCKRQIGERKAVLKRIMEEKKREWQRIQGDISEKQRTIDQIQADLDRQAENIEQQQEITAGAMANDWYAQWAAGDIAQQQAETTDIQADTAIDILEAKQKKNVLIAAGLLAVAYFMK